MTRYALGGYLTFRKNQHFSVRLDTFYSVKGCHYAGESDQDEKVTVSMQYIDVPILGVYNPINNLDVFTGLSIGFYLDGEVKIEDKGETRTDDLEDIFDVNSRDFSLVIGATYYISHFLVDTRYMYSFTNLMKMDIELEIHHSVIQLMIGYNF